MARKNSETPPEETAAEEAPVSGGRSFVVRHMGISGPITPFLQGQVVSEEELQYVDGVDIERLIALGAIEEGDGTEGEPVMEHDENQAFITSTGHVVDQPGLDRPDVVSRVRAREINVKSAAERLQMFGRGRRKAAKDGVEVDPTSRDPEAVAEQQRVQRNLRDNVTVPAEIAEQLTETDKATDPDAYDAVAAEYEGEAEVVNPDDLAPVDPARAPDMVPEPRGGRAGRRGR